VKAFGTPPPPDNRLAFETHLASLGEQARVAMVDLRKFVLSLGSNVIEEVRPHRVVYSKTMNFRVFLDVKPSADDSLVLVIKSGRSALSTTTTIKTVRDVENIKKQIVEAYQKIQ